ncbi:MAG TPA: hypothetical protein PLE74_07800 [Candidatus Cloacimonadota bacterium]|nr:hypothetical protein [Candidatus Cloacimonadota bacterium]
MSTNITTTIETVEGENVTVWRIEKDEGAIVININKILGEDVTDCHWEGNHQTYLIAEYSDWDSNELWAIIDANGQLIKKGIRSIEQYIAKYQLFIVEMSGFALGYEATEYDLAPDDWKMAVINKHGDYIIPPKYPQIDFEEGDDFFYVKNYSSEDIRKVSINGTSID